MFVLLFCASALSAFLGWIMEMLGRDYGISGGAWQIIFYIIAALLIAAGIERQKTTLILHDGTRFIADESYDEVKELIAKAVQ